MHIDKKLLHKLFLLVACCLVFAWLLLDTARASQVFTAVWDLFSPFVVGAGIAFVFNVPMRAIERQLDGIRRPGIRRGLAVLLTIAALILVIMFVVELLVPQIRLTAVSLSERIPAFIEKTAAQLMVLMEEYPSLKEWIQDFLDLESLDWTKILKDVLAFLGDKGTTMMGGAVNVIGSVTSGIVNTVIAIAFSMYCLARKEILARQGRRILYALAPEKAADETVRILRLTNATFSNFISGQCLEACILGCLFAVAMAIFGMPYIPLVSVIIAVTALIPVVGAFVGCIVGAFFILVDSPLQALTFVVMFLVLQQLENNLIYPRVVGTSIGLPGMWVLVAVTVGGELMGVGGMLVMIPLTSVLYTLAREFTDKRLAMRGIPEDKLQDHPPEIKSQFQKNKERKQRLKLQKMKEKFQEMQEKKKNDHE
ncbi:MAG: AI-2E family transporter [Faecousia sp.]